MPVSFETGKYINETKQSQTVEEENSPNSIEDKNQTIGADGSESATSSFDQTPNVPEYIESSPIVESAPPVREYSIIDDAKLFFSEGLGASVIKGSANAVGPTDVISETRSPETEQFMNWQPEENRHLYT
jgi:hypothetical protein